MATKEENALYRRLYPAINLRLPAGETASGIDSVADDFGMSRAGACRALIRFALSRREEFYEWISSRDADRTKPRISA